MSISILPPMLLSLQVSAQGLRLVGLKLYQTPQQVAEEHYKELSEKPFYPKLVEYIVSGPVVAMVSHIICDH